MQTEVYYESGVLGCCDFGYRRIGGSDWFKKVMEPAFIAGFRFI